MRLRSGSTYERRELELDLCLRLNRGTAHVSPCGEAGREATEAASVQDSCVVAFLCQLVQVGVVDEGLAILAIGWKITGARGLQALDDSLPVDTSIISTERHASRDCGVQVAPSCQSHFFQRSCARHIRRRGLH